MKKKIQIPAVHDKDLRTILDKFGLSEKIDKKMIKCHNCSRDITWDNLFGIRIIDNVAILFCDEPECIEQSSN